MFVYLPNSELVHLSNKGPEDFIIIIDKSIVGKEELISKISHGVNSPYLEDNWDGLEEALSDLSWILNGTVRIIHLDLPKLSEGDLKVYVSILKVVVNGWENSDKNVYLQDLKVYFPDSLKQRIENMSSTVML